LRVDRAQEAALGKVVARSAWVTLARGPRRREPRPDAETVDFADDSIARHADLVGDLAAAQSRIDVSLELIDPLLGPGCVRHGMAS